MKKFFGSSAKYFLLTAVPLGLLVVLMWYYADDMMYYEDWGYAHILEKLHNNTITLSYLFEQSNEHRLPIPKIVFLINAMFFNGSLYLHYALNVLIAIGTSIIIFYAVEKMNFSAVKRAILYLTSAFLIFSFNQEINWFHGGQMTVFMCVFSALFSILLLTYGGGGISFIFAIFSGFVTTFAFANGMLTWPIGLFLLVMNDYSQKKKFNYWKISTWVFFALICLYLYFRDFNLAGFPEASVSDKIKLLVAKPYIYITLFFTYLGVPLANYRQSAALGLGIIGFVIYVYSILNITRAKSWDKNKLFWLAVGLFAILSGLVTSFGRTKHISTTMSSRYMSVNMLFWISNICLTSSAHELKNNISLKWYLLFAALIVSHTLSEDALITARERYDSRTIFKQQMQEGKFDDKLFVKYISPRSRVNTALLINTLKKYGAKNFEHATTIEFDDFSPATINADDIKMREGTSFGLDDEPRYTMDFGRSWNSVSLVGWWKVDSMTMQEREDAKTFIVLYNDDGAFEARAWKPNETHRFGDKISEKYDFAKATKYSDVYELYKRNYFICYELYYGKIPSGKYNMTLKVAADNGEIYYFPLDRTVTVR